MSEDLVVQVATEVEKAEAFANVFEVWPCGDSLEAHVQWRLNSPQHSRAVWYVGLRRGRVVCSLGAYPMEYLMRGAARKGIAIGAVHTLAEFRGQGFAQRLIERVESMEADRGAALALLFSDISVEYYERLGYQVCPAEQLQFRSSLAAGSAIWELVSPQDEIAWVRSLYEAAIRDLPFAVSRDAAYWSYLERKADRERILAVRYADRRLGYVRLDLDQSQSRLRITDYAFPEVEAAEVWKRLPATLGSYAQRNGLDGVTGWAPGLAMLSGQTVTSPREQEITMLKPLAKDLKIDGSVRAACAELREIDHV